MQSALTMTEGRLIALFMLLMSTGALLASHYYRQGIETAQRKARLWILQEIQQGELSQETLEARLLHTNCYTCQLSLLEAAKWLEAKGYVTLKDKIYLLTERGINQLQSKQPDPNFATPGWVRLLGHIHPLL